MASVSITGKDIVVLDGRIFSDFADADTATLDFPNDIMAGKTGKNGNTIIAYNSTGKNVDTTLRLVLGSADDKFLNSRLASFISDPASFVPMTGEFTKRSGDGQGNVNSLVYALSTGIPQKIPNTKENVEGDTEQAVAVWQIRFYNGSRNIS